jgi:predicted CoA-substrate-specific enzyme activase
MNFFAGIDVGSRTTKACILKEDDILSSAIIDTTFDVQAIALKAVTMATEKSKIDLSKISYIVATGYGRVNVPFAHRHVTEISCHALGMNYLYPEVRTILDMGGQDLKVIRCDEIGRVTKFVMNDKCAAGTGRFLERIAEIFNLSLKVMSDLSLSPKNGPCEISSYCAVFALDDALSLVRTGADLNDVVAGLFDSVTEKILQMIQKLGLEEKFAICGGIAKNKGIVERLRKVLNLEVIVPEDPQIIGALGAAIFARRFFGELKKGA